MKFTQFQLLRNGLRALPAITTLGGAATAYLLFGLGGAAPGDDQFWQQIIKNIAIGGAMGFLGGMAASLLGQAVLHHVNVEDDPIHRKKRKADNSPGTSSTASVAYTKADLEDHQRSTTKTLKKYEEKKNEEKAERKQILEIGTEGLAQKKREQLGIKSSSTNKSGVSKSSANQSGANKSNTSKSGNNKSGVKK
jgi:hypothetical protein